MPLSIVDIMNFTNYFSVLSLKFKTKKSRKVRICDFQFIDSI